ncbi:MAG: TonB-dependent receptor plug domain-containing protein, partial [Bdellovibrionales bacterium]|nr:TonB-dependent receptor plug domain-containing protein [Bdellovibrionales bacterium]
MKYWFLSANLIVGFCFLANAQEELSLEKLKVRGTKNQRSVYDTSDSVSVLQEKDVVIGGSENNLEILNAVPNVEVNKNGDSFSIRGINSTGATGYQKDNLASLIVDNIFQTDLALQAGSFSLWDMERLEVLRGAQSTQLGVNSLAGAILLDHQSPRSNREGAAKIALGNLGHKETGIVVNQPLSSHFYLRLNYDKELHEGFIDNTITGKTNWGGWDKDRAGLNMKWQPTDKDEFELGAKFHQNRQGGTYTQGTEPFADHVFEDQDFIQNTLNHQYRMKYDRKFSENLSASAVGTFSKSEQAIFSDADGTSQPTAGTRQDFHNDHYGSLETL